MATLIAFSARKGDHLRVKEDPQAVREAMLPNALTGGGLCQLTRIPSKFEVFEPVTVYIRPEQIAYLHEASE